MFLRHVKYAKREFVVEEASIMLFALGVEVRCGAGTS